jgi:translocation and assembly module TamB
LSGNLITSFAVDSIDIRDKRGDRLLSAGPISFTLSPRDLIDSRIYIYRLNIEHPYVHLIQHATGVWNFQEIFASGNNQPSKPKDPNTRNFGDYIVIDSTSTRNASFSLTLPWRPDERGAARDSVIKAHLSNPAKMVTKTFDGYGRTYAWTNAHGFISHVRLADPDSDRKVGQEFRVDTLSADEFEPTFKFRNVRADVRRLGDSLWFTAHHFDMPASTGTGKGKVWWGSDLPMRYDIAIRGDSVSLDDVNWVYPTLPRTGGGTLDLLIKNDPKNLQIIDFKLSKMDVRTEKSHVIGDMTFGTGAPLLLVQNVDLRADPVDFDLLRTLAGKPFPEDWQGKLIGTVKARGGPLTHFYVDDARGVFEDAHVPGAVSRFTGKGELDILVPANTVFHGLYVDAAAVDLRTIEYLFPSIPPIHGVVSGTATLDSSYLDVRFSNAHLVHQDGPGDPSRVSGGGRVTYGPYMIYDLALEAQPLSWTMLARSFPWLPMRGLMSGPIRVKGTSPDLEISTSLQGASGAFSYDGRADVDSIGGYSAHGRGQFSALNLAALLEKPAIPLATLSGHYNIDVAGANAATLQGSADLSLDRTVIDSVLIFPSYARVRFADGRMIVDSLHVPTRAGTLVAQGAIGLPQGRPDSLHFTLTVDSLGGWRPLISHADTTLLGVPLPPDSLSGSASITGDATGTFDLLNVRGRVTGSGLYMNKESAEVVGGTFDIHDLLRAPSGSVAVRVDTAVLAGVTLDTLGISARFDSLQAGQFSLGALSHNGPTLSTLGRWQLADATKTLVLDSMALTVGADKWRLAQPVRLAMDSVGKRLDSLVLRNGDSAVVAISGSVPNSGAAAGQLRASRIPLGEFAALAQFRDSVSGVAELSATIGGTKLSPRIDASAALTSLRVDGFPIDSVLGTALYRDQRLVSNARLVRGGQTALAAQADLPMDMTLFSVPRKIAGPISGELHADTTDLSIVSTLLAIGGTLPAGTVDSVMGKLRANAKLSGKWGAEVFNGDLQVIGGSAIVRPLGVKIVDINGGIFGALNSTGTQDSIAVNFSAANDKQPAGTLRLNGWFNLPAQSRTAPALDLTLEASQFHALGKRSLAELYLSTIDPLRLHGTLRADTLDGSLRVDRGAIYLADRDLARKLAVEEVADTAATPVAASAPAFLTTLMTNLQGGVAITLGDNVRLLSSEANVRLNGQLNLLTSTARSTRATAAGTLIPKFSLEGQLRTVDGTYLLNLTVVQREFTVLPDGVVTFDGPPETPTLDINALYNVKQYRDRDIGVIVNLHGRMPNPSIDFKSTTEYAISQSDLVSYLITGRPGLDLGGGANSTGASQVLANVIAPTLSAVAAAGLRQNLGSWFDMLQFQLGSADNTPGQNPLDPRNFGQYLNGATIGAEKQFGGNLYFNVNTGLCQFTPNASSFTALGGVGAKVEYRFDPQLSIQLAYDPPTANRICSRESQLLNGFQPTPGQFSFSLSHTWRF